ncbi:hypothetical protein NQD34_000999 [Periophthalmus magnuspinnatus]|nr:hypothetical protein NQD34_000999 [Periophthalmus magnuspinnatus]
MKLLSSLLVSVLLLALASAVPVQDAAGPDATARPKSHCEHHRDKIQTQGRPLIGAYVPQCDADGEYSAEQCHGSTGYCWCVDANGREHQGTKTPPGADRAECTTKDDPARRKTHCEHHKDRVPTSAEGHPLIGAYVPQCDANGEYSPKQCHGSTGYCWCVDANGREHEGTKTPPGLGSVECTTKDDPPRRKTNCEHSRDKAPSNAGGPPIAGAYVPQCDANGEYEPQQCHPSTGHCWCVDTNGREHEGTKTAPGADRVECTTKDDPPRRKTQCEHHKEKAGTNAEGLPMLGAFIPQCDANGEYSPQQCHGSTGHCWCVDANGQEHEGTKTPPGADHVECTRADDPARRKTHCEHRRDRAPSNAGGPPIAGAYVPQCDANGEYEPKQCHGSTGHCWCVDVNGQEREGTRTPPGASRVECKRTG